MVEHNSRILGYNIATSIGYSFILTIIMAIVSLIVKAFYPPSTFDISPIEAMIHSPAEGIVQILILVILVAFVFPTRTTLEKSSLIQVRKIALITASSYLVFSLLPYAFQVSYPQTYLGLTIAYNLLNGVFAGFISTIV
ncbi:hypothetical protein [Saccharolobus islandicus]|uniref:Uncharacterized protein n=1 Tax=Saccharolobus islandicus (strain REY15A) TaxID=930945 RepID=F0NH63_SACI5|nr:hypothetical protein [Sulfolobus islandicus]ADX84862.1 conserved hypothetical protein [Sulfolobus islandicus REY15A]